MRFLQENTMQEKFFKIWPNYFGIDRFKISKIRIPQMQK
jgi:hypothetical protein